MQLHLEDRAAAARREWQAAAAAAAKAKMPFEAALAQFWLESDPRAEASPAQKALRVAAAVHFGSGGGGG
eukprot:1741710-Prymnesium_polylepis.1